MLTAVAAALALVLVVVVLTVVLLALVSRRSTAKANEVVPGVATNAPPAWARAHSPEAKLHRRLRDAVATLRALPDADGLGVHRRASAERAALAIDEHLVVVSLLPAAQRAEPMAQLVEQTARLEAAIAALAHGSVGEGGRAEAALAELDDSLRHLADARAELDGLARPAPADDLTQVLEQLRSDDAAADEAAGPGQTEPG